jgi:hypothetical protein
MHKNINQGKEYQAMTLCLPTPSPPITSPSYYLSHLPLTPPPSFLT